MFEVTLPEEQFQHCSFEYLTSVLQTNRNVGSKKIKFDTEVQGASEWIVISCSSLAPSPISLPCCTCLTPKILL